MKNKGLIILLVVVVVILAGILFWQNAGEGMMGFSRLSQKNPCTTSTTQTANLTVTLDPGSASGSHVVAATDKLALFDVCAGAQRAKIDGMKFSFTSNGRLNLDEDGKTVIVRQDDLEVGSGPLEMNSTSDGSVYVAFSEPSEVAANSCREYTVITNSDTILNVSAGADDILVVALDAIYSSLSTVNSMPVAGNSLRY